MKTTINLILSAQKHGTYKFKSNVYEYYEIDDY